jgi:hypothetical protein
MTRINEDEKNVERMNARGAKQLERSAIVPRQKIN